MPDYETLDNIADAYVPLLALLSLFSLSRTAYLSRWRQLATDTALFVSILLIAYGLMFLDNYLGIWPAFGLDYSTHTAVALALVIFLMSSTKHYSAYLLGSLVLYFLLMLYQGYHSLADILTTAVVVSLCRLPLTMLVSRTNSVKAQ